MKKTFYLFSILLFLSSCSSKSTSEKTNTPPAETKLEEIIERHIENDLKIPPSEKYSFKIYKAHLDSDDKLDAIITVNRLDYAKHKAAESKNPSIQKATGYEGQYNYFFFYDGGLNKVSPSVLVPSSPLSELRVEFQNVTSEVYKDVLIDYDLTVASFRDFFTVKNHCPILVFQWEKFNISNIKKPVVNHFEYGEGTVGLAKDILIYEGEITNLSSFNSIYNFKPIITKKGELLHRFFYFENEGKYFTKK
jgi:hypothetical protein